MFAGVICVSALCRSLLIFPEAYIPGYPAWIWRLKPGGDMQLSSEIHARLRKNAVDLPSRFVKVKTSKTGELVQIPIFPLLQDVLEKVEPNDSPFVFPEQEKMYVLNPDNITLRFKKVMRAAGFLDLDVARVIEWAYCG